MVAKPIAVSFSAPHGPADSLFLALLAPPPPLLTATPSPSPRPIAGRDAPRGLAAAVLVPQGPAVVRWPLSALRSVSPSCALSRPLRAPCRLSPTLPSSPPLPITGWPWAGRGEEMRLPTVDWGIDATHHHHRSSQTRSLIPPISAPSSTDAKDARLPRAPSTSSSAGRPVGPPAAHRLHRFDPAAIHTPPRVVDSFGRPRTRRRAPLFRLGRFG